MIVDFLLISTNVDHDNSKHVMIMEAAGFWWIRFYPAAYLEAPWQVAVALLMIATGGDFLADFLLMSTDDDRDNSLWWLW